MKKLLLTILFTLVLSGGAYANIIEMGKCYRAETSFINFKYKWTERGYQFGNTFFFSYHEPSVYNNQWHVRSQQPGIYYENFTNQEIKEELIDYDFYPVTRYNKNIISIDLATGIVSHLTEETNEFYQTEPLKHYNALKTVVEKRGSNQNDAESLKAKYDMAFNKKWKRFEIKKFQIVDSVGGVIIAYDVNDSNFPLEKRWSIKIDLNTQSFEKDTYERLGDENHSLYLCTDQYQQIEVPEFDFANFAIEKDSGNKIAKKDFEAINQEDFRFIKCPDPVTSDMLIFRTFYRNENWLIGVTDNENVSPITGVAYYAEYDQNSNQDMITWFNVGGKENEKGVINYIFFRNSKELLISVADISNDEYQYIASNNGQDLDQRIAEIMGQKRKSNSVETFNLKNCSFGTPGNISDTKEDELKNNSVFKNILGGLLKK